MQGQTITEENRHRSFWSKVDIKGPDECWNFRGCKNSSGYGNTWDGNKNIYAHRYAWEFYHKCRVPKGKLILHHCDNKLCCNPTHLYCGTYYDNMYDRTLRGRVNAEKMAFSLAKLYASEIQTIRKLLKTTRHIQADIAKQFNVERTLISRIKNSERVACRDGYFL